MGCSWILVVFTDYYGDAMNPIAIFFCVAALMGQPDSKMPLVTVDNKQFQRVCLSKSHNAYSCTIGSQVIFPSYVEWESVRWRQLLAHEYAHALGANEVKAQWVERNGGCENAR